MLFKALDNLIDEREGGRNGEKRYAVLLRFMSMFRVRREEDVLLEQRTEFADLDKMTYVEAREHIFTFLLEEETAKLYALHDQKRPETEKLDSLKWLNKNNPLSISYETSISLLYNAILHARNGKALDRREVRRLINGCLKNMPDNQSAHLEFLLLFRLLIDEKLCDKEELADLWKMFALRFHFVLRYAFDFGENAIVDIFEVRIFLNERMDAILSKRAICANPDVTRTLIEIIAAVGAYDRLEMSLLHTTWEQATDELLPATMFVLRKKLLASSWNRYSQNLLEEIIERYNRIFGANTVAATELLCAIADRGIPISTKFWNACGYSLSGFHFVLSESVSAAARLLTL